MGDQVTPVTIESLVKRYDGAAHHCAVLELGKRRPEAVTTRHGARDRWDWGVTLDSLMVAQDRERQADRLVKQMTSEEREGIWTDDGPGQALLRRAARRMR